MPELNFNELQPYLFVIGGLVLLIIALFRKASKSHLKQSGLKAEGIIFQLDKEPNYIGSISGGSSIRNKVTVRFVTQKQEWITGDINQEFATFFTGQYKEGESVTVYYDPDSPSQFFVDTKQSAALSRVVLAVAGLGFALIGVYQLLIK